MTAYVWVLSRGEKGEGHSPFAVFFDKLSAQRYLKKHYPHEFAAPVGSNEFGNCCWSANGTDEMHLQRIAGEVSDAVWGRWEAVRAREADKGRPA